MGPGLTVAHSIAEKLKGHTTIESKDKETSAPFHAPARVGKKEETLKPAQKVVPKPATKKRKKILIMDDEEIVREVICGMLDREGHRCEEAKDGSEAIRKYELAMDSGGSFDIVIMDLTVPGGMGGIKAVKEILKIDPNAKVIVVSGYASDPVMENYREYGFCGSVSKPFGRDELLETMMSA